MKKYYRPFCFLLMAISLVTMAIPAFSPDRGLGFATPAKTLSTAPLRGGRSVAAPHQDVPNPADALPWPAEDKSACKGRAERALEEAEAPFKAIWTVADECARYFGNRQQDYFDAVIRFAPLPPQVGLPMLAAELESKIGKHGTRCVLRGLVKATMPAGPSTETALKTIDAVGEYNDLKSDLSKVTGILKGVWTGTAAFENFQKGLDKARLAGLLDLEARARFENKKKYKSLFESIRELFQNRESQSRDTFEQAKESARSCNFKNAYDGFDAATLDALQVLHDVRLAIRSDQAELRCDLEIGGSSETASLKVSIQEGMAENERLTSYIQEIARAKAAVREREKQLKEERGTAMRQAEALINARDFSNANRKLQLLQDVYFKGCPDEAEWQRFLALRRRLHDAEQAPASPPPTPTQNLTNFQGEWDAVLHLGYPLTLKLTQSGDGVAIKDGNVIGTISGTVIGRSVKYVWTGADGKKRTGEITLSEDGKSFSGNFVHPWGEIVAFRGSRKTPVPKSNNTASVAGGLPAASVDVEVLSSLGDVEISPGGDDTKAHAIRAGDVIRQSDRIVTAMDAQVKLRFPDGSIVIVGELTDMKVAAFSDIGNLIQYRIWLKGGQISAEHDAKVNERPSDFSVKTPTATTGPRGTRFIVRHSVQTVVTSISVTKGAVEVTPEDSSLRSFILRANQRVEVALNRVGPIIGISSAEAGNAEPGCNPFEGVFNTTYGPITLQRNGNRVTGSYHNHPSGPGVRLSGVVSGNTLEGEWVDPNHSNPKYQRGRFRFVLNADGKGWNGQWWDANGGYGGVANGTCAGSANNPGGGSGGGGGTSAGGICANPQTLAIMDYWLLRANPP